MSNITINHLTFAYPGQDNIFTDQTLQLDNSWHLGLTGRNGRGKTTLLNLLQGKLHGDSNTTITALQTFNYFPQAVPDPTLDTWQILDAITTAELWEVQREMTQLHLDDTVLYQPWSTLSGGEQTKLLLAVLFADTTSYPLIDEPTNHLDHTSRHQIAGYLAAKKQGYIVISHDRAFLDATTDHTLTIEKQQLILTAGNFSAYEAAKKIRDQTEKAEQATLRKDIGRLHQTAVKKRAWSASTESDKWGDPHKFRSGSVGDKGAIGAQAARVMQKAKNLEHRMDREIASKEALLKNVEHIDPLTLHYTPDHHDVLLRLRNVTLSYNGKQLFAPVSFELKRGERLALVGPNGSGKSSLIAAILSQTAKDGQNVTGQNVPPFAGELSGEITLAQSARRALVRQLYQDNTGTLTQFAAARHLDYQELLSNLHKLGVERSVFTTLIENMSAGQQKKVELAASMVTDAAVFIWDEPLNYLDVFNQDQLIDVIKAVQPTMLLTEHDQHFIETVATKVVELQ